MWSVLWSVRDVMMSRGPVVATSRHCSAVLNALIVATIQCDFIVSDTGDQQSAASEQP